MKISVITGIKGQGASYMADLLLKEGHKVVGLYRRCATLDLDNIKHILHNKNFQLVEADITDSSSISKVLSDYKPWSLLNFAAQSHVGSSYTQPIVTAEVNYLAVAKMLEAVRVNSPSTRFWQASTSERYGNSSEIQSEDTPPSPISPYAVSKVAAEYLVNAYKETYNLHSSYSIMYNYESPRRSVGFVTRKITSYLGYSLNQVLKYRQDNEDIETKFIDCINNSIIEPLYLGNIDTFRSWTHCSDTIKGVYEQIKLKEPTNLVFALEETHSVREFLDQAFSTIGIKDWSNIVKIDKSLFRPSDVRHLEPHGLDKTQRIIKWKPEFTFKQIVLDMVTHDIEKYRTL